MCNAYPLTFAEAKRKLLHSAAHHALLHSELMRLLVLLLLGFLLLVGSIVGLAQTMASKPVSPLEYVNSTNPQVIRGAKTYDLVCSDCHGDTGLGLAEGRLSFDPAHQRCEQCHKTFNAPTKANTNLSERNSFNLGEPPALRGENAGGEGVLAHLANAATLNAYISTAMPRYDPGVLEPGEYVDITAFLLELNGLLPAGLTLTAENAATVSLRSD